MNKGISKGSSARRIADALALATQHSQAGRFDAAETVLFQILRETPDQPDTLHLLGIVAHQAGRTQAGIELIERALRVAPDVAGFQANVAEMYRRVGNLQKAIEHGSRAIALKSDHADAHFNLGLATLDMGDHLAALVHFDHALQLRPRFAEAINGRGNALRAHGRLTEAEKEFRRALAIRPSYPQAYNSLGNVLSDLGRPAEAVLAYNKALALKPGYFDALNNQILAYKDLRRFEEALASAEQALGLSPGNADTLARIVAVHLDRKDPDAALAALNTLLAKGPEKAQTYDMLGRAYFQTNDVEKAVSAYRKAIELKPDFAEAYDNLGNALSELGRFDEAVAAFDKSLELDPSRTDVYLDLANAKKFRSSDDRHLHAIESQIAGLHALPAERQLRLHFALAKAYDDLARHEEAFAHFREGNALKRRAMTYDEGLELAFFERIKAVATYDTMRAKTAGGDPSTKPIFVIGMARSGSTLVEQIIAGHQRVKALGEIKDLKLAVESAHGLDGRVARYPELLRDFSRAELAQIGEKYLRTLERHAPNAERIVDKALANFFFVGLIHLALPNARIIHVRREPLDTCFSCFSKLFAEGWPQTYDLAELGRFYRAYLDLMNHWRCVLPQGAFLDVEYEMVVADVEGEARRILEYCGLAWDERVLDFHKHERPIKTASAAQVRQPIYDSSVGRWRSYEKFLGPLIAEIETDGLSR